MAIRLFTARPIARGTLQAIGARHISQSHLARISMENPTWLQDLYADQSSGPKLYAWNSDNLAESKGNDLALAHSTKHPGSDTNRRIFILGIGNLGRLYASTLAQLPDRPPISLVVHRKSLLEEWTSRPGVEMTRAGVTERFTDFDLEWWTDEKPQTGPVREVCDGGIIPNLVVSTKAQDALAQVDRLRRYLDGNSTVAFVQNGMNRLWPPYGTEYSSRRYAADQHPNWLVCVTTHGVTSLGPFRSVHASPADVAMGPVLLCPGKGSKAEYLTEQITTAPHLVARHVSRAALWILQLEKLVVNSIINSLTAILRCKNGVLFARPGSVYEQVMDLLLEEASCVLRALVQDGSSQELLREEKGDDMQGQGNDNIDARRCELLERFSTARLKQMLLGVAVKVRDNTSSMLQDVIAGKGTEIREFNGWLVDTAERLGGMDLVNHKTLIDLVERKVVVEGEDGLRRYFPAVEDRSSRSEVE